MTGYDNVLIRQEEKLCILTLNNPDKRNLLSENILLSINELLNELRAEAKGQDVGYYEPEPFSRIQTYQVGSNLEDIGTYVGAGIGILPRESVERVFRMPEYLEDTAVLELENRPAAIAVEFVELIPAPYEEFETVRQDVKQRLSDAGYRQALRDWLDPENIRARTGFELVE